MENLASEHLPFPEESPEESDEALLERARTGERTAFEALFRRYHPMAVRTAARLTASGDPQDIAAEAFARIWSALLGGGGPDHAFAAYLRTTVRNLAAGLGTRCREDPTADDRIELAIDAQANGDGFTTDHAEHEIISKAFTGLPERWRSILWLVDVEGRRTTEVARHLGLSPNSAAALTKRARDGLSRAWLQEHVEHNGDAPECRWTMTHLAAFARHALRGAQAARVQDHLDQCEACSSTSGKVSHLAQSLRLLALIGLGTGAGAGWYVTSTPEAAAIQQPAETVSAPPTGSAPALRGARSISRLPTLAAVAAAPVALVAGAVAFFGVTSASPAVPDGLQLAAAAPMSPATAPRATASHGLVSSEAGPTPHPMPGSAGTAATSTSPPAETQTATQAATRLPGQSVVPGPTSAIPTVVLPAGLPVASLPPSTAPTSASPSSVPPSATPTSINPSPTTPPASPDPEPSGTTPVAPAGPTISPTAMPTAPSLPAPPSAIAPAPEPTSVPPTSAPTTPQPPSSPTSVPPTSATPTSTQGCHWHARWGWWCSAEPNR